MAESSLKIDETDGVTVVGFKDASILDVLTIQKIGRELYELIEKKGKRTRRTGFPCVSPASVVV